MTNQSSLIDSFGRQVRYLRLSVTDRCNLRCTYCMAEDMTFLPKSEILTLEEMLYIAQAFVELGVTKIRLTGGEPLVRKGIVSLAQNLRDLPGLEELVMTTNGVLLDEYAQPLKEAGVSRLNISIDSLRADVFKKMTRFGDVNQVLNGIKAAKKAGYKKIKLNAVVLRGINDQDIIDLADYAVDNGLDISFIEEMPLGEIDSHQRSQTALDNQTLEQQLKTRFSLRSFDNNDLASGPSRYFSVENSETKIGFISPMSNNFCASCNRVRLTVKGKLLLCLGNDNALNLRDIIRDNPANVELLKSRIVDAMVHKPEKHFFDAKKVTIMRHMNVTGG